MLKSSRNYLQVPGVYRIVCLENNRSYVGATFNICSRIAKHVSDLASGIHKNKTLQKDYDIYGKECFDVIIVSSMPNATSESLLCAELEVFEIFMDNIYNIAKPTIIRQNAGYIHLPEFNHVDIADFWHSVQKIDSACWEWRGRVNQNRYGVFRKYLSHRVSYFLNTGQQPGKMQVMHSCDNPPCVNPAHLSLGTNRDNALDRIKKRRGKNIKWHASDVIEIRRLYSDEGIPIRKLEKLYPHNSGISNICRNRTWVDETYNPPPKKEHTKYFLTAFGETKPIKEWALDPRCKTNADTIRWRMYNGINDERALDEIKPRQRQRHEKEINYERLDKIRELISLGCTMPQMNDILKSFGWHRTNRNEIDSIWSHSVG